MFRAGIPGALALALVFVWATGCGGGHAGAPSTTPQAKGVEAAALPYRVLRARGGSELDDETFFAELAAARAICLGESHSNPHHHWFQLHVIDRIAKRGSPTPYALGMEMFQRPFQGVLDDYGAGRIDDRALLDRAAWKDRWGFDFSLYRPMIRRAVDAGMALLALNTPRELTKKVAKEGLDSLTEAERQLLPELVLDDQTHRAWFQSMMDAHPHGHGDKPAASGPEGDGENADPAAAQAAAEAARAQAERIYSAQVLWDETMAQTSAEWLAGDPARRMFILAGKGHCHDSAIVGRLERRGVGDALSVMPIIDDGEGNVAAELAQPSVDYLFVMSPR